ncbi:hypothetical protein BKA70DRAFT_1231430 [Coprinopsis sp. MPI-PUGE-AT-0042]|nr:hypothetical protein BKA70DRAFT_1231430 [Coprinopsis sp. MPI-PUGE-AT-0042]
MGSGVGLLRFGLAGCDPIAWGVEGREGVVADDAGRRRSVFRPLGIGVCIATQAAVISTHQSSLSLLDHQLPNDREYWPSFVELDCRLAGLRNGSGIQRRWHTAHCGWPSGQGHLETRPTRAFGLSLNDTLADTLTDRGCQNTRFASVLKRNLGHNVASNDIATRRYLCQTLNEMGLDF